MKKDKALLGIISIIICEVLFGFSFLFTKRITDSVSPFTLLSWRFITAFAAMNLLVLARLIKVDFRNKRILSLFSIAIFQPVIYFIGETFGVKLTTASESGVIIACYPIVALLVSTVVLKEAPTKQQVTGIGTAAAGIILIVLMKGLEASFNPLGYILLLLALLSYSMYSVNSQKAAEFTNTEKTYAMIALGAGVFTAVAVVENAGSGKLKEFLLLPFSNMEYLVAFLYLGVGCSAAAFFLYNVAISSIGTNRSASFAGLSTIVTVIAGIILLKENFSLIQGVGTLLVLGGVYLANIVSDSRKPGKEAE
ncbi:MAG TPA: DMT family transporter [Clostridia bacterium]|nr:DMT family transporter [Clostridia bacterium]